MAKRDAMDIISDWKNEKDYVITVGYNGTTNVITISRKIFSEMTGLVDGAITSDVAVSLLRTKYEQSSSLATSIKKFANDNGLLELLGIS